MLTFKELFYTGTTTKDGWILNILNPKTPVVWYEAKSNQGRKDNIRYMYHLSKFVMNIKEPTYLLIEKVYENIEDFEYKVEYKALSHSCSYKFETLTVKGAEIDLSMFNTDERLLITTHIKKLTEKKEKEEYAKRKEIKRKELTQLLKGET